MAKMEVKIYIVLQRVNLRKTETDPNVRVLSTHLTRVSAQNVVDAVPGTWIEKSFASK